MWCGGECGATTPADAPITSTTTTTVHCCPHSTNMTHDHQRSAAPEHDTQRQPPQTPTNSTHLVRLVEQDADVVSFVAQVVWVALLGEGPVGLLDLLYSGIVVNLHTYMHGVSVSWGCQCRVCLCVCGRGQRC